MDHGNGLFEITAILTLAALLGILGQKLRQPLLIMFLIVGVLAGPSGLGLIGSHEEIELLAHLGIAVLLFIVGLKLDPHLVRTTGPTALLAGAVQIALTAGLGFLLALAFGVPARAALYVGLGTAFSSTIVIVKLLSDKQEVDSLHGQIAVGILIVQDIAAIGALVLLTTLGAGVEAHSGRSMLGASLSILLKGTGLLIGVGLAMRYLLPPLVRTLARSLELLSLFALAWAVFLGGVSYGIGFNQEIGAFLAGFSLAATDYKDAIGGRLIGLRDFLLLFFFVDLGARMDWSALGAHAGAFVGLSAFVLIGKPLLVLGTLGLMGYRRRTAFLSGVTLGQISEFSFILAALGMELNALDAEVMGLLTFVGIGTILVSSYLILYAGRLYEPLSGVLKLFERRDPKREPLEAAEKTGGTIDVLLVGLGNYGGQIAEHLLRRKRRLLGVDFDPHALERWKERGLPVVYGDVSDPELYEHLPLDRCRWVACTVRVREVNLALLRHLRRCGYAGRVALSAVNLQEAELYEQEGAHVVFRPLSDAAEHAADALSYAMDALPDRLHWPLIFREVRVPAGSPVAGRTLREAAFRTSVGVTVLAVGRSGRITLDPPPDFVLQAGDRLLLTGTVSQLREAEALLQPVGAPSVEESGRFAVAEVQVAAGSPLEGRSLAESRFRQTYGATVVGIERNGERLLFPGPDEKLQAGDLLILIGGQEAIRALQERSSL
ncbi:MAG: potassium/proton antiporter [Candidatus Poribacteria bacterium]|nr:MAG: potassium/proton antiporter [Candidatus Poribacteria bacterium]